MDSDFNKILQEVIPKDVPLKYVEQIKVTFEDGTELVMMGDDLTLPIAKIEAPNPNKKKELKHNNDDHHYNIMEIQIVLDTETIEQEVKKTVSKILTKSFKK